MVSVSKRPETVHSSSILRGKDWTYLSNFTSADGYVAQCNNISTKTGATNKPNPVTLSNYGFNIPDNAIITNITVRWKDRFLSYETDTDERLFPNFDDSTLTFNNCNLQPITLKKPSINFEVKTVDIPNPVITPAELNSTNFGVTLQYSFNNSNNIGGIYCDFVKIIVNYEVPKYNVSITEPRHKGSNVTWSTPEDPTLLSIGESCSTQVKIRSTNGYDGGQQTVRINVPINYKMNSIMVESGELVIGDGTYFDWIVSPPLDNQGGLCTVVNCNITFTPRAFVETEMISATILSTGQNAKYYVRVSSNVNYMDDIGVVCPVFSRLDDVKPFTITVNVENILQEYLEDNNDIYPVQFKLWSVEDNEYVPFCVSPYNDTQVSNTNITPQLVNSGDRRTYYLDLLFNNYDTYENRVRTAVYLSLYQFTGDAGEYEFHVFIPHNSALSNYDKYVQSVWIDEEYHADFNISAERWEIKTCNIATTDGEGYSFNCQTANGFQYKIEMRGTQSILEERVRHIGGLRLAKSHYKPKLKFSNKVNEGRFKNRAYYNKSGEWVHDLDLKIYLPKFDWKTLQEFVKMDKPVAIDTCPSCSDDDVLNHRGWVEVEDISNVERVNGWWYKGEIGVKRITDKYFARANIVKGNRVCSSRIPYSLIDTVESGEYYLNYFDLLGGGQLLYDPDNGIINQLIVSTGETLHIRSKWVNKDIDDYKFNWRSVLPSEATDESNDYKYNSIVYSVIDNRTGEIILSYTLYDFTTFGETGDVVNTCKASCTLFDKDNKPTLLFTKQIKLDYDESDPTEYWSTTRFQFSANTLTISESGVTGEELIERDIILRSGEYLMDIAFCNNDVGLLEPDFISYLDMDLKENMLANPLSNFYSDLLISPFVIPDLKLLFYRYGEEGVLYYYYGDTTASYLVDGFQQYKCGVDLQTSTGASIMYVDNYTNVLFLNNGLCKVGFDRLFGTIQFYVYDTTTRGFVYVNMVKIDDWNDFEVLSITDDKAIVQFGNTIWSMWRGHPFVQCEHINTDLRINDDYDTILCESMVTSDGDVIYDGSYGKREQYLYSVITTPVLTVEGENSPNFISGDDVTFKCYLLDRFGEKFNETNYPDPNKIGKILFSINNETSFIDVTPQTDSNGDYYWSYTYTPPFETAEYNVYARFIPVGDFTESTSGSVYYTVHKIDSSLTLNGNSNVVLSDRIYHITIGLSGLDNNPIEGIVKVYEEDKGLLATLTTEDDGGAEFNYTLENTDEFLNFYAVYGGNNTYKGNRSNTLRVVVKDDTKTDVTITPNITIGNNGRVTLVFNGASSGNVKVTFDGEEYVFPITSSKQVVVDSVGRYPYTVEYLGDNTYNRAIYTNSITINKEDTTLSIGNNSVSSLNLGEKLQFTITSSKSSIPCVLYDNDSPVANITLTNRTGTIKYAPTYSGQHQFKVVYKGDTWTNSKTSNLINVNVINSITHLTHCNGEVYRGQKDYVKLTDNQNNPIANKQIQYTVNGVTYNKITDSNGYMEITINLREGNYNVHVLFAGDNAYQTSSIDYTLTVIPAKTVWKTPSAITTLHNKRTAPYQIWNNIGFDSLDGTGYCTCGYSTNINTVIGTRSGTWNTPDQINFANFGFNIPSNATVTQLQARIYERQYDPLSDNLPNIGSASIDVGNDLGVRTCSNPPLKARNGWSIETVAWSNPKLAISTINSSTFMAMVNHSRNTATTTGCLMLKYFELGVSYTTPTVKEV